MSVASTRGSTSVYGDVWRPAEHQRTSSRSSEVQRALRTPCGSPVERLTFERVLRGALPPAVRGPYLRTLSSTGASTTGQPYSAGRPSPPTRDVQTDDRMRCDTQPAVRLKRDPGSVVICPYGRPAPSRVGRSAPPPCTLCAVRRRRSRIAWSPRGLGRWSAEGVRLSAANPRLACRVRRCWRTPMFTAALAPLTRGVDAVPASIEAIPSMLA
jgi:hypothetical protein